MKPFANFLPLYLALVALSFAPVWASELPDDLAIHEAVDRAIDEKLREKDVEPAPQADDATLVRRLYLDLAGRTPTAVEARAFVDDPSSDKRGELVQRLLDSDDFVRHRRNEWDAMLAYEDQVEGEFRDYLLEAARENRPWDQMFRELLLTDERPKEPAVELTFLRQRGKDLDRMTTDASSVFFGVNISCAKCHDHPLAPDWKQDHFYGMQSFFSRTFVTKSNHLGERDEGIVKFKTTEGETKEAALMFLTGKTLEEPPAPEKDDKQKQKESQRLKELEKKKAPPPEPEFSRREQLVEVALEDGQRHFFARNIVNRVWSRLFGHGLVNPLDQMHSENPPTHPELLDWLAEDLMEHDYDLRRLVGGLAMSQAYSRDSRWGEEERPSQDLFAVALPRPLAPRQYALSLLVASSASDLVAEDLSAEEWDKRLEGLEKRAEGFARSVERLPTDGQISVTEALLFSNSERVERDFLSESKDRLLGQLKEIEEPEEKVAAAMWNVLSRPPDEEELAALSDYLAAREDRPADAMKQMVWALLASTEMRFNH